MQNLINKIMDTLDPNDVVIGAKDYIWEDAHLVALGKPASFYAKALANHYSFQSILAVTKTDHSLDVDFEQWEASHPLPTPRNLKITKDLKNYLVGKDRVVFLISGGASSLLVDPKLEWDRFLEIWKTMLLGGWGIEDMNKVRILMSHLKGGGLAVKNTQNLYVSDVPKDHFNLVSSSPTNSVELDPFELKSLIKKIPEYENDLLKCLNEYQKPAKQTIENYLLLSGDVFRGKVCELLKEEYPECEIILDETLASENLESFLERVPELRPKQIWVSVGEAAVNVSSPGGIGGRNSHLVGIMQNKLKENEVFLSLATDGSDGNSPMAGGYIGPNSIPDSEISLEIQRFNTGSILNKYNLHFDVPAGLTNLMDLRIKFSL